MVSNDDINVVYTQPKLHNIKSDGSGPALGATHVFEVPVNTVWSVIGIEVTQSVANDDMYIRLEDPTTHTINLKKCSTSLSEMFYPPHKMQLTAGWQVQGVYVNGTSRYMSTHLLVEEESVY